MTIDPSDLIFEAWPRLDKSTGMVFGVSNGVKVIHRPSGETVVATHCNRQIDNKKAALKELEALLSSR